MSGGVGAMLKSYSMGVTVNRYMTLLKSTARRSQPGGGRGRRGRRPVGIPGLPGTGGGAGATL